MYIMIYNGAKWLKVTNIDKLYINGEPYRGFGQILDVTSQFIIVGYNRIVTAIPTNVFVLEEVENEVI